MVRSFSIVRDDIDSKIILENKSDQSSISEVINNVERDDNSQISLHRDTNKRSIAELKSKKLNGEVFGASIGEIISSKLKEKQKVAKRNNS